jgi:hypothetical protein
MRLVLKRHTALRAFLTGDDAFDRISALLDEDDSWQAYGTLAEAAFGVAARRRFPGGYKTDDTIRFVGRTRAALQDEADRIDPRTAERLLRSVLSDPAYAAGLDQDATALAMMAMLKALVTEEGLSGPDLDVFLAESRDEARRQVSSRRLVLASSAVSAGRHSRRTLAAGMPGQWASTLRSCWRRDARHGGRSRSRRLPQMPSRTVAVGPTRGAQATAWYGTDERALGWLWPRATVRSVCGTRMAGTVGRRPILRELRALPTRILMHRRPACLFVVRLTPAVLQRHFGLALRWPLGRAISIRA